MADDQAQNYLSRSLAPHTGVVSRPTGAARRLVADGVAPTSVRISLGHRAVKSARASRAAGSSAPFPAWCVAAPAQSRQLMTQRDEHDQPTGI